MSKVVSDVKIADHLTQPGQEVRVRVTIGEAQKGAWVMLLGNQHKAGGTSADIVRLGTGAELTGTHLEVSAIIQDVRPDTDQLTLTVDVIGASTTTVKLSHTGAPGDAAAYSVIVFFH